MAEPVYHLVLFDPQRPYPTRYQVQETYASEEEALAALHAQYTGWPLCQPQLPNVGRKHPGSKEWAFVEACYYAQPCDPPNQCLHTHEFLDHLDRDTRPLPRGGTR